MEERIAKMQQRVFAVFQEEMEKWVNDILKDAFDPRKFMAFIRSMGIDMSMFPGMVGQPGFDPYAIFHLDRSASDEQIKQAYRKVMSHIHPDKAGPELTFLASIVNAAYEYICKERGIT